MNMVIGHDNGMTMGHEDWDMKTGSMRTRTVMAMDEYSDA